MSGKLVGSKAKKVKTERVELSSGNVFSDLGFADADERMLKAQLAVKIAELIERKGWTQVQNC